MSTTNTPAGSSTDLARRLSLLWPLKAFLLLALTVLFCLPYLYLGHHAFFRIHIPASLPIDRWAGYDPRWVWAYQSVYLLTSTLPWLATCRDQLRRYVNGFAFLSATCLLVYVFFPTACPRPPVTAPSGMYSLLLFYDGPYNAFPSLHAGFLYYTLAFALRVCPRPPQLAIAILIPWSLLILWATLATKEHYFIDLPAGIALAVVADRAAWSKIRLNLASKSHPGSK